MPDDLEPVKTDVVMYGVAAKIYNENDSKVIKTWKEGEKIWIAWTQKYSILYNNLCSSINRNFFLAFVHV